MHSLSVPTASNVATVVKWTPVYVSFIHSMPGAGNLATAHLSADADSMGTDTHSQCSLCSTLIHAFNSSMGTDTYPMLGTKPDANQLLKT